MTTLFNEAGELQKVRFTSKHENFKQLLQHTFELLHETYKDTHTVFFTELNHFAFNARTENIGFWLQQAEIESVSITETDVFIHKINSGLTVLFNIKEKSVFISC